MRTLQRLRALGLLGINRRNASYTLRYNLRHLYPLVDDKLQTKRLCQDHGIPTARLLGVARRVGDLRGLLEQLSDEQSFVLKPARGAMGNGILVIRGREGNRLQKAGGDWIDDELFLHHASGILSGLYALGGQPDAAFVEEKLTVHSELTAICRNGVPDYRVIVFRGIPVMAMTRLPTESSGGRANLHQGAVGVGVDLRSGRSTSAVIRSVPTNRHPDTGEIVVDRPLPEFDKALRIAVAATELTGLGYVGADVVVDAKYGPVVLELNARPGLAVQIANRAGLLPRLEAVEERWRDGISTDERVEIGREIASRVRRTA